MTAAWPAADRPTAAAALRRRALLDAEAAGDLAMVAIGRDDTDDRVRSTAWVIGHRNGSWSGPDLANAVADGSSRVRRTAAELAAADVAIDLGSLLDDPDPTVVETACWAAGERGPAGADHLDRLMAICAHHDDALCREAAVAALGAIGDPRALDTILAATADRATVRRRAVLALAPFDDPAVDAALEAALGDRDWQVRQAAEDLR